MQALTSGIKMLQITLVIEDKISLDDLQEEIAELEDYVQSTDVAGELSFALADLVTNTADTISHAKALSAVASWVLRRSRRYATDCKEDLASLRCKGFVSFRLLRITTTSRFGRP
jgi:hypothetical protein